MADIPPTASPLTQTTHIHEDQEVHNSTPEHSHSTTTAEGTLASHIKRVICICLDETSGRDAFYWAVNEFINPQQDLVMLLNVRQIDLPVAPYINASGYLDEIGEERREASHHLLRHYASKLAKKKIACKAISMVGDPKTEVVRKVKEVKADAVVVGSRNYGLIKRTLLGSVSDYLAHHCETCTVIIARPPRETANTSAASP